VEGQTTRFEEVGMGELLMDETTMRPAPLSFEEFFRDELVSLVSLATAITGSRSDGEDVA